MNGIILLDKQQNITSFSACNRVRRLLGVKKAGHTGTLDPMATGVLTVALSNCTRFIELLPVHDKSYEARARLGITTDTLDITGEVLSENKVNITLDELMKVSEKFKGEIMQTPPMYSAVSKDGKRLYELARQGIEVEREQRKVTVHSLELSDFDGRDFTLKVSCSGGTYIRSLIDDIGKVLGCGAVMTELRRTSANGFSIENAHTLEEIENAVGNGTIEKFIIPIEACFSTLEKITVTEPQAKRFSNGGTLSLDRLRKKYSDAVYTVFSPNGNFLGLGEAVNSENELKVRRVYVED